MHTDIYPKKLWLPAGRFPPDCYQAVSVSRATLITLYYPTLILAFKGADFRSLSTTFQGIINTVLKRGDDMVSWSIDPNHTKSWKMVCHSQAFDLWQVPRRSPLLKIVLIWVNFGFWLQNLLFVLIQFDGFGVVSLKPLTCYDQDPIS